MPGVTATRVAEGVTLGTNSLKGIAAAAPVNGLVPSDLFFAIGGQDPAGAISPAEFERIEIVDGIAYLGVAVYTNSAVKTEGEGWGVATNGVIEVPAPDKQGFFLLMSKGAEKEERAK